MQTITPYLLYEDAAAALDFLSRAFGFEKERRITASDFGSPGAGSRSPADPSILDAAHVAHARVGVFECS